jgi:glycosyltransferase involved in cell wall biosynthesis
MDRVPKTGLDVALVHDWLNQQGGAENVLLELHEMYPEAPTYTSFYDPKLVDQAFAGLDIRTTWMQRLPFWRNNHQALMPLYPLAFRTTKIKASELVISNCSAFCKGVRISGEATHVCYCLTPTRFLWTPDNYLAGERAPIGARLVLPPLLKLARRWDYRAAQRVSQFVAISNAVADRILKFYGRSSIVVHPPVNVDRFAPTSRVGDHFLIVSRLVPYKRIDLAVQTCTELGLPLRIIGTGRAEANLRSIAGPTVKFVGRLPDREVSHEMSRCRALLFPGEEDFGIAPVEAQAAGRPVVAFAAGGALDTVVEGETGILFSEQTVASMGTALHQMQSAEFSTEKLMANASRFSIEKFQHAFGAAVNQSLQSTRQRARSPA